MKEEDAGNFGYKLNPVESFSISQEKRNESTVMSQSISAKGRSRVMSVKLDSECQLGTSSICTKVQTQRVLARTANLLFYFFQQ